MRTTGTSPLVQQAHSIAELAGQRAEKAEAARTPDPDVVDALVAAGAARHFVPISLGGSGGTFAELKQAAVVIGARCPATAWCAVVAALMTRTANHLPPAGQRKLWAGGQDTLIAGGVMPRGVAAAVEGGWSLSGSWPAVSSSERADWILLSATVRATDGPEQRIFLVPATDARVDRTWDAVGMQATGSHTVAVEQVFVPDTMAFPASALTELETPPAGPDGRAVPLPAVNTFLFALPMLGAARGALRYWKELTGARLQGRPGAYDPVLAHYADVFARSSSEIDAAELLLDRIAHVIDTASAVTRADVARNQRDCAFAAELLLRAVDRLMGASGTSGHSTGSALQRLWRDIHTAGSHATLQFGPAAAQYTRTELMHTN
ncbi:acyl-CoA dehydrogenase family protein [Streptomyces sp. NPDC005236]|uniref:acyl-CoA dehydrogenase family protein n=1 Tax=Streptomyces sp. NPDC005236 TaxID=3157028 RepID=UPI0033A72AE8